MHAGGQGGLSGLAEEMKVIGREGPGIDLGGILLGQGGQTRERNRSDPAVHCLA